MNTKFQCKICGKEIEINLDDPKAYIQKTNIENALLGNLYSYRVAHRAEENINHINVIIVDKNGDYRAHRDSYEELEESADELVQKWSFYSSFFPYELRSYLNLATTDLKKALVEQDLPKDVRPKSFLEYLKAMIANYPQFDLLHFLAAKWAYIIGMSEYLHSIAPAQHSLAYLYTVGLSKPDIDAEKQLETIENLDSFFSEYQNNDIVAAEIVHTKAWYFFRTSDTEKLGSLYNTIKESWKEKLDLSYKTVLYTVSTLYSHHLQRRGQITDSLNLLEPAFSYAQLIGDRKMILVVGNIYAGTLRVGGNVDRAFTIYSLIHPIAEELEDERSIFAVVGNLAIIEAVQGKFQSALERFLSNLESPINEENIIFKLSTYSNISLIYYELEQYNKSIEFAKLGIDSKAPIALLANSYGVMTKVARKTHDKELIQYVIKNIPEHEFFETPKGKLIKIDINATLAELNENWTEMIEHLHQALSLTTKETMLEEAIGIKIRLAEAYFKLYRFNNHIDDLNSCYKYLDLARDVAIEANYNNELVKLTLLKGTLAAQAGSKERSEMLLKEALEMAQKHNLSALKEDVQESLDNLYSGKLCSSESSSVNLFNKLKDFVPTNPVKPKTKSIVELIWITSETYHWEIMIKTSEEIPQTLVEYMFGLRDLWKYAKKEIMQRGITTIHGKHQLIIETSENFTMVVVCSQSSYQIRMKLGEMLEKMENFHMKHINEEIAELVLELGTKSWNNAIEVYLD